MVTYLVQVATGGQIGSASSDVISIALVGVNGESPKQLLGDTFPAGSVQQYDINTPADLGQILFVRLYKELGVHKDNPWKCKYVNVTSPSGESTRFPCYMWLSGLMTMEVQEGKGIILTNDVNPLTVQQRKIELDRNREIYRWKVYADGAPYCIDASDAKELPPDARFSFQKYASFSFTLATTGLEIQLKGFTTCPDPWTDLNDINKVFLYKKTHNSVLVSQMWKEDTFFGYEFLNGVNPVLIRKCIKIPGNFPVDQEMVAAILGTSTDLNKELENGNLYLADYSILEGVPANTINGQQQYLAAPLCLLWKNPQDQLLPMAIQLGQTPGPNNPIFLSSDPEWDWTLAKIWVRNSDLQVHEIGPHLLRTHLLAEVFNIATARQLPMGHPLYKLIVPHLRYTLEINVLARIQLIGPGGLFDEAFVTGNGGVPVLLKKAVDELTYTCLCLPDDIKERGMESVPNYYYREDGMKVWLAVERLVSGIVNYYYKDDDMVSKDPELQAWVEEIFTKGFLGRTSTGIPSSLGSRTELIKYLTMVIFTCSGQHAAVNSGQFDFFSWLPNGPSSMRKPPPPVKGAATYQTLLDALPEVNTTTNAMAVEWLLSHEPEDKRPLGNFQNERFTEETPQAIIKEFQESLAGISKQIQERNSTIQGLTYLYLDPKNIESSVSI
ncbi:hydroperoxide isomerase ALOXE3-like [Pelobates fuscus]|uniref:hydroperoxide isomerase ALOXE3-like n=1 Tax=Pelobates fuscus TaxID=191477 RepID=UPI002FE4D82A